MDLFTLLQLVLGLGLLTLGAESLVRGASRAAGLLGVSPLMIGLTIVAYGTSTPELLVSIYAALEGNRDIAVANVVGSNILNTLLILGICASIRPLVVAQQLLVRELPFMIAVSVTTLLLALDGEISRIEGLCLVAAAITYTAYLVRGSRKESDAIKAQYAEAFAPSATATSGLLSQAGWIVFGLALLVLGARWLVTAAVTIAAAFGVSDLVIGLTIVAVGTSLPELATSLVAALRNERDIAIGNVVGSNLYNLLAVLGLSAVCAPGGLGINPQVIQVDLPVMIGAAVACLPLFFTGRTLSRPEGMLFIAYYAAYIAYLVLAAQHHDSLPMFSTVMLNVVVPASLLVILVSAWRHWRNKPRSPAATRP